MHWGSDGQGSFFPRKKKQCEKKRTQFRDLEAASAILRFNDLLALMIRWDLQDGHLDESFLSVFLMSGVWLSLQVSRQLVGSYSSGFRSSTGHSYGLYSYGLLEWLSFL